MRDLIYWLIDHPLQCRLLGHRRLYGSGTKQIDGLNHQFCRRCLDWYRAQ